MEHYLEDTEIGPRYYWFGDDSRRGGLVVHPNAPDGEPVGVSYDFLHRRRGKQEITVARAKELQAEIDALRPAPPTDPLEVLNKLLESAELSDTESLAQEDASRLPRCMSPLSCLARDVAALEAQAQAFRNAHEKQDVQQVALLAFTIATVSERVRWWPIQKHVMATRIGGRNATQKLKAKTERERHAKRREAKHLMKEYQQAHPGCKKRVAEQHVAVELGVTARTIRNRCKPA